ncbi:MAG: hypothetical protein KAV82_13530 [Phycisphaerae bacterium]|nr:hypothetical protein [Phycisphaerae bacterium]
MHRSMRTVCGLVFGAVVVALLCRMALVQAAPAAGVQTEYEKRVAQLKPDDIAGHLELALWCKDHGAYRLVRKQCTLILAQDANHEQAKLLLKLAMRHLGEQEPPSDRSADPEQDGPEQNFSELGRIISDEEIRRIRWIELMDEEPRQLSIRFKNNVVRRFLEAMEGKGGFTTRAQRRDFMRLKPTEKLRVIRKHTGDRFAKDIIIRTDPKRMADFGRRVLPVVLSGCATSHCHGGPNQSSFAIYNGRMLSKNKVYTNYLLMHNYRVGNKRVINRDTPRKSLLLTYGFRELPPGLDPTYKHPVEIKPVFSGANDPKYRAVCEWLDSLSALEPDYGISLKQPFSKNP